MVSGDEVVKDRDGRMKPLPQNRHRCKKRWTQWRRGDRESGFHDVPTPPEGTLLVEEMNWTILWGQVRKVDG